MMVSSRRQGRPRQALSLGLYGLLSASLVVIAQPFQAESATPAAQKDPRRSAPSDWAQPLSRRKASGVARPVALNKQGTVLLDKSADRLLLKAKVVLREGLLEMLCCLKNTKEHESILALDAKAFVVHSGLLALGVEAGKPVQFVPDYRPPSGSKIDIYVRWKDQAGREHRERAQSWVRHARYRFHVAPLDALPKGVTLPADSSLRFDARNHEVTWYGPMTDRQRDDLLALTPDTAFHKIVQAFYRQSQPRGMSAEWVFVGSGFYTDQQTGQRFYMAEGGDLICVANFPSATIDVAAPSTSSGNENLMFEAYTEHIPPIGTDVIIELSPVPKPKTSRELPRDQRPPSS